MFKEILLGCITLWSTQLSAQDAIPLKNSRQRLDFAKTYFELGSTYMPSFTGKRVLNGGIASFTQPASLHQHLTWGAFHFWGHAEFYVTFPINQLLLNKQAETGFRFDHSVVTGGRYYPWAMREKRVTPYVGVYWGGLDFQQLIKPEENQPKLSKDFLLNYEAGLLYNYKSFGLRLKVTYYSDTKWNYPVSRTQKADIKTPPVTATLGLLYAFDLSKDNKPATIDRWNSYPSFSKLSHKARKFGDFFIAAGPSLSFSLAKSSYNQQTLPYLKDRLSSKSYFDFSLGYHFNRANLFTAVSFRNPKFETEGYNSKQTIKKTSLTLDVNKFLTDYSGFAPFVGLNVAYDKLDYHQTIDGVERSIAFKHKIEPGVTFGWDIVPGKTEEALIIRTNLRWYPFSKFDIDGKAFDFKQLEYNLVQLVFYPDRLRKRTR